MRVLLPRLNARSGHPLAEFSPLFGKHSPKFCIPRALAGFDRLMVFFNVAPTRFFSLFPMGFVSLSLFALGPAKFRCGVFGKEFCATECADSIFPIWLRLSVESRHARGATESGASRGSACLRWKIAAASAPPVSHRQQLGRAVRHHMAEGVPGGVNVDGQNNSPCLESIRSSQRNPGSGALPSVARTSSRSQTNHALRWGGLPSPVKSSFQRIR